MIGRTLNHYEIVELLGAGGMGEVYRAHDTTLKRDVAIKVLPVDLAEDPERLARLQREAHLLASLNHPNIASIYSLEEADGVRFLVLELVEGETLGERLVGSDLGGRLEVREALGLARQIAEALEAAHSKGIIHRDLKPANIKITPDDQVKVLDFGLAKAYVEEAPVSEMSPDLTKSPTMADATKTGMILGTAAYMSPEQARVRPLDKRTDIWSFGCVLYEMLTGQRPFQGGTISDTLAAILRGEPDWEALPAETPGSVRTLLRRCLNKDIKRRMHDMGDVWLELEEAPEQAAIEQAALGEAALGRGTGDLAQRWKRVLPWALFAATALVSVTLGAWLAMRPQSSDHSADVVRFVPTTAPLAIGAHPCSPVMALSPDGTILAYVSGDGAVGQIYLRRMDSLESIPVEGAETARTPFFSPDGEWVGFESDGELWRAPVAGGKAWPICEASLVHGATWLDDGTIIYGDVDLGLARVSADRGVPETLVAAEREAYEFWLAWPEVLPNGDVLFTPLDGAGFSMGMNLFSPTTGTRKRLLDEGGNVRYLPTGHLVFPLDGSLMAVRFDVDRGEIIGNPFPVIDGVLMGFPWDPPIAHYSIAESGSLVYLSGPMLANTVQIQRVDRAGEMIQIGDDLERALGPRFSPDGRRMAISSPTTDEGPKLWVYDLERGTWTRLISDGQAWWPLWSPDGRNLAFTTVLPDGLAAIFTIPADGSGSAERLIQTEYPQQSSGWSADGQTLLLNQNDHPETKWDVMMFRPGEDTEANPLLNSPAMELLPHLSPDGRWLAYVSDESGRTEVYVQSFPELGNKWQISTDGGTEPIWSPDGTELFYRDAEALEMIVVDITLEPEFRPGTPRVLFEGRFIATPGYGRNYDVAPDGQSFLMFQQNMAGIESAELRLVLNWQEELKQQAASQR